MIPWCRYADDALAHCKTEQQAQELLMKLKERFKECGLELHPDKTKIVYCKDSNRKNEYSNTKFEFLGYSFQRRLVKNKEKKMFMGFTAAVSKSAQQSMREKTRSHKFYKRTYMSLNDIADIINPMIRGWIEYYGRYQASALYPVFRHFNKTLVTWAMNKYRNFKGHKSCAANFLESISKREPGLFAHWKIGMVGAFA